MKAMMIPIVIGALRTIPKRIGKGTGRLGDKRTSGDHPDYRIIKISQNTEKSSRDFEETCFQLNSSGKPSANGGVKNSQRSNNDNNNDDKQVQQTDIKGV